MNRWMVRRVLWPAHERLRRRGTTRLLRELCANERSPAEALRQQQAAALREVLAHAAQATRYYAWQFDRHHLDVRAVNDLADLVRVPVLTRALVRAHLEEMIDPQARRRLAPYATSGSTGEPMRFYIDRRRTAADNAARARARLWWGVWPGDPEVMVWGSRAELERRGHWARLRDRLFNLRVLPAADLGDRALDEMLNRLRRRQPVVVFGYATALGRLAAHALESAGTAQVALKSRPRVVIATAEVLQAKDRQAIAAAFGCGVATEYGARELGVVAHECPRGSLHVAAEQALVEALPADGDQPLPPGETGELVVTLLRPYGMPMIRYRTGDLGSLSPAPCGCGVGLPVLAAVEGRQRDLLRLPGGRVVHPSVFSTALAEVDGLSRYRVVQVESGRIVIQVCLPEIGGQHAGGAPVARRHPTHAVPRFPPGLAPAVERIRTALGPEVAIVVDRVDSLPVDPSGKFRWVLASGK